MNKLVASLGGISKVTELREWIDARPALMADASVRLAEFVM
jgi:hypothetical protein